MVWNQWPAKPGQTVIMPPDSATPKVLYRKTTTATCAQTPSTQRAEDSYALSITATWTPGGAAFTFSAQVYVSSKHMS